MHVEFNLLNRIIQKKIYNLLIHFQYNIVMYNIVCYLNSFVINEIEFYYHQNKLVKAL